MSPNGLVLNEVTSHFWWWWWWRCSVFLSLALRWFGWLKRTRVTLVRSPEIELWRGPVFTLSQVDLCVSQLTLHASHCHSQTTPDNCSQKTALLKIGHSDTQVPPREAAQQSDRWSLWNTPCHRLSQVTECRSRASPCQL